MDFTEQEQRELRELLGERRAIIRLAKSPPPFSKRIGQVGRYAVVVLVAKFTTALDIVLIPQNLCQAVSEYKEPIGNVIAAIDSVAATIDLAALVEHSRPLSGERSPIGQPMIQIQATTNTTNMSLIHFG